MNKNYFEQIDKEHAIAMMSVFRTAIDDYRFGRNPNWGALTAYSFEQMVATNCYTDGPGFARHEAWKAAYATMVQQPKFDKLLHGMFWCEANFPAFGAEQEALRNAWSDEEAQEIAWAFFEKNRNRRAA